ncbi:hypothetical protein [Longispora urticae]
MNTFKVRRRLAAILLGAVCAGIAVLGVAAVDTPSQGAHEVVVATATTEADIIWT